MLPRDQTPRNAMPSVFLALPENGFVWSDSREAAYCRPYLEPTNPTFVINTCKVGNSLLAHCFNLCWVQMLNHPRPYDFFAMLHADVSPEPMGWLEHMIGECSEGGWDVLHAPSPIKDLRGLLSTCVMRGTRERRWEARRRVTLQELERLPRTFGLDDLLSLWGDGHGFRGDTDDLCLAPNTGCLLIDLRNPAWRRFPGFTVEDALTVLTPDGRTVNVAEGEESPQGEVVANVVPEDWALGAWAWRQGLRVGGTKLKLSHAGQGQYHSAGEWGWARDEEFLSH